MLINKRYYYNRQLGIIVDLEGSVESRLEPRQQAVLELLIEHKNQILKRDIIEKEVWDNYGGANDGINQAISVLRKALNDSNKTLIKTIPKKGYLLDANLDINSKIPTADKPPSFSRRRLFVYFTIGSILALLYYIFKVIFKNKSADEL